MKVLKSNNRVLAYLICFSLLAFVNISCNENEDLESFIEASEKEKFAAKTMAKGNIKRTRVKKRPNGMYKTVVSIKNNEENSQVSTIALEIEKQDGLIKESKTYILNLDKENKNARTFSFDEIKIEGEELVGKEITVNLTLLDSNQKQIGEIISETITVTGPKIRANIKRTRVKQRTNGMYRSSIVVNNDTDNTVSTVALEIESKKGLIPETKTYYLDYFTTVKGKKYYTYADIKFENPDVVNQEVNIKVTLLDTDKKPISTSTGTTVIAGLSNANIKTGRTRMKQRPNGLYKMTAEIENNEDNDVAEVEITVNDLQGNTTTFNVNPNKNNTINTNFSFEKETISEKMSVTYLLRDFYGEIINRFKEEVTVESNIKIGSSKIKLRPNGLISASINIKKDTENQVNTIKLQIEKEEGLVSETLIYILKDYESIKNIKYFTFYGLKFDNDDIVGKEVNIKITLLDNNQKPIGKPYVERRVEILKAKYNTDKMRDMEG